MQQEHHTIDAAQKRLGRVATEVATLLMGKHRTDAARNTVPPVVITITNASKLFLTEKKKLQTEYDRYTGHPDGRRILSMRKMIEQKGCRELLRKAVYGMLPNNKLRAQRMKQLTIAE